MTLVVMNPPANTGGIRDTGSVPGSERSPGGEHGNPLQYSCLENRMDRGAQQATAHGVAQSRAQQRQLRTLTQRPVSVLTPILTNITDLHRNYLFTGELIRRYHYSCGSFPELKRGFESYSFQRSILNYGAVIPS